jgi:hypothetical protein
MQARYYDPVIGRFYSNDPVGNSGKVKVGGHIGLIKIEVEVDTSKLN